MNPTTHHHILAIARDGAFTAWLEQSLPTDEFTLEMTARPSVAENHLRREAFACVVAYVARGDEIVLTELGTIAAESFTPLLVVVEDGDVTSAVRAMRRGADMVVEQGCSRESLRQVLLDTIEEADRPFDPDNDPRAAIVRHERSPLNELLALFPQIALSDAPVLLQGESGTGKELFAQTLHAMSERRDGPFVEVQCAAIPEDMLEIELFGHAAGAFRGATGDKPGYFQLAPGGTIFLNEICSMPAHLQVKLLRVLEDRRVTPVGSSQPIDLDFRTLAASKRNLEEEIAAGRFRQDLYFRLSVFPIHLPALRERPMDIPALADHFIAEHNRLQGTSIERLSPEIRALLKRYEWPGNVRELHNVVQRLCILKQTGAVEEDDLPPIFFERDPFENLGLDVPSEGMDMASTLERLEGRLLTMAMAKAAGNKARAARLLGLNRTTLVEKLKRKQLDLPEK